MSKLLYFTDLCASNRIWSYDFKSVRVQVPPPAPASRCPRFEAEKIAGHHDPASAWGWHHPARANTFELAGNLSARTPFFEVPGKSGKPVPAPAAQDGTILT